MKYWRLNYASEPLLETMISTSSVICTDSDFEISLRVADGILLARFDEASRTGQVRAIGLVSDINRISGKPVVRWKRVSEVLHPSTQGQKFWRQLKPYFAFATTVVKNYRLNELFARHFSGADTNELICRAVQTNQQSANGGYVYVIRSQYGYKIGKTKRMKERSQLFSVKLPFPIEIVHFAWFDDYSAAELKFHQTFSSKRLEGEWFNLSALDLAKIKSMK